MKRESAVRAAPQGVDGAQTSAERLSAWLDGEVDPPAGMAAADELLRDPARRRDFAAWCMVGDALRSQEVAAEHSPRLCTRIAEALENEPALLAPRALPVHHWKRNIASGVAVAAAMAVIVLVAVPILRGTGGDGQSPALVALRGAAPGAAVERVAESAAVPAVPNPRRARDPQLDAYFQAHRDFDGAGVMPAAAVYLRSGSEGER